MAKTQIKNYVFKPGIGATEYVYPNAYSLLSANKSFIQKEATAWIADQVTAGAAGFVGYTYNQAKCERDVGYVVDAYLKDLRYGGNENVIKTIKYYWDQDVAQVDGDRQPEIQTHTFISTLIRDYIFANNLYSASNSEVTQTVNASSPAEATQQFTPTDASYTPTTGVMTLTIGTHSLKVGDEIHIAPGAITFTCLLDGGATTHPYPRASGVPNAKGRDPYYYAPLKIASVTGTTVTMNVGISSDTSVHSFDSATSNGVTTGPSAKINTLAFNTVDTITNGLNGLPTLVPTGVGTIKVQGRWDLDQFLLVTNTTSNEIIYNFSSIETGGSVSLKTDNIALDPDFSKYLETTDAIATLKLNYNTSGHNATDDLQIFVEKIENGKSVVTTRPHDFGTDAIERPRAALPVSMLDADFEYGLQPTKWAAISTMRGYPSIYEIPGTDTSVLTVETDASAGTDGIGQSLITVTTVGAHGFEVGTPITIKALEDSVSGASRAEGSFVINAVPSTSSFTYFAKAKVGTVNPSTLSTTYTQLRQAGFYTGSSIGSNLATSVISNGFNGTMISELDVSIGSTIIPFDGPAPGPGAPLTNSNIPVGSQVTGVNDTSAGGGTYLTPAITADVAIGENRVYVDSVSGIVPSLATDRGDGTAININTIDSNFVEFDDNFTSALTANVKTYTAISGTNDSVIGIDATFNVTQSGNVARDYTVSINDAGTDYKVSDRIIIGGEELGGVTVVNDLTIRVTGISAAGGITNITFDGAHWDGSLSVTGASASYAGGTGSGAIFDLDSAAGAYTSVVVSTGTVAYTNPTSTYNVGAGFGGTFDITRTLSVYSVTLDAPGQDYIVNETFTVLGTDLGGASPANDATVTIDSVSGTGAILTLSITGTAINTQDASTGYIATDKILILGSDAGGVDGIHDVYVTVNGVNGSGAITSLSYAGTPPAYVRSYQSGQTGFTTTSANGAGIIFSIDQAGTEYTINITSAGTNFLPTETITVTGDKLAGATPANDMVITIDNVDANGAVTVATVTGTGSTSASYNGVSNNSNVIGSGATFDVTDNGAGYTVTTNSGGTGYGAGQTLTILGNLVAGASPANDITIVIGTVDAISTGVIATISSSGTIATPGGTFTAAEGTNDQPIGTSAAFNVNRNFAAYSTISTSAAGTGYKIGDRIILSGTDLDGASTINDILVTIATVGSGGDITSVTYTYQEAIYGSNFDLISTVIMTEATTGAIVKNENITYEALPILEVTFPNAHGLVPGDTFITTVTSDDGSNNHELAGGAFLATNIPAVNKIQYQARSPGNIDIATSDLQLSVYPRPDSFFVHRPFDGGVQLGTGGPQHGAQAIRQSKKYIRYQSGKGIMYTTGALFAPSYDIRSITSDGVEVGSLITIETDDNDHGVQAGGVIRLLGVETPGFNSGTQTAVPPVFDYTVEGVIDERTFTIRAQRRLGATTAVLGFGAQMSVVSWHGATVRSGIFDDQNGIFWEFDGTTVSVVQRTGTRQLAGTISLQVDNNLITGSNTRFTDQLKAGDRIVIKGMTHVVSHVNSQTEITVTPDWRGVIDIGGAKANLIVDKKTKQSEFNLDKLDGTGPSGYDIDIAKMQMIGIQYSWYGAGFIDFMLRGSDGNFVFAHRMRNSNVNTEAFMRSGNLPVRYEVSNEGPSGKLNEPLTSSQVTVPLIDSSFFPHYGTIYIDNEIMTFTGNDKTTNTLTGVTRGATFINFQAGATRNYNAGSAVAHNDRTGVILISQTITPLISHWGSAFITDGGFDEDRGYIFSYSETGIEVTTIKQTAFLIRLSPSVSNALIGDLGERELLNRAQLLLQSLEITSEGQNSGTPIEGGIVVEGVLNPQNYPLNPADIGWQGLSGLAQGGQPSFAQIASGGSVQWSTGDASVQTAVTTQAAITATVTAVDRGFRGNNTSWDNTLENSRNYFFVTNTFYNANTALFEVGVGVQTASNNRYPSGTTITSVSGYTYSSNGKGNLRLVFTSQRPTSDVVNTDEAIVLTKTFKGAPTNQLFFEKASFENSGAKGGTTVLDAKFPSGTAVSGVSLDSYNGTQYYNVTFNQSSNSTAITAGSTTVTFDFTNPPFAQPGETVFSFIATPGERATVDFSALKELTNTPLGGRGTYPNGPDVLAINVYKVSGADTNANVILNWGEAQA